MKVKTNFKIFITLGIMLLVMLSIGTTKVNATTNVISEDNIVFTKNEVEDGLVAGIRKSSDVYYLGIDQQKLLELITNTTKLNSLIQSDSQIYQKFYYKLDDTITKVTMTYRDETEKEAEIVTINDVKYAEIPISVICKVEGIYTPAIRGDGIGILSNYGEATIKLYQEETLTNTVALEIDTEEFYNVKTAFVGLNSDTDKEYEIGGAGFGVSCGIHYDRVLAEGNCYVYLTTEVKVGETINVEPFGTLTYKGTTTVDDYTKYTYQAKITDKTIFNKDRIICNVALKDYNVLGITVLNFSGDLIEIAEDVVLNDEDTNIKLESDTDVIPVDTILVVKNIEEGTMYRAVQSMFSSSRNFKVFDITLESNGVAIQPNGNVKISIPIPSEFDTSNLVVYRVEDDGTKVKYDVTVEDGYAVFETDHFSTYVLADGEITETQNTQTSTGTSDEKDETPKTGTFDIIGYVLAITVLAGVGITLLTKGAINNEYKK